MSTDRERGGRHKGRINGPFFALQPALFWSEHFLAMKPSARVVYLTICLKAGQVNKDRVRAGSKVQVSYGELKKLCGLSKQTTIDATRELITAGFLNKEHGDWKDGPYGGGPWRWIILK